MRRTTRYTGEVGFTLNLDRRNRRELVLLLLGIALAVLTPFFLHFVAALGYRIPQPDRASDYLKGVDFAMAFTLLLIVAPLRSDEKKVLLTLWGVRCFVTLFLMLFYEWHYGLDAYWYFEMSQARNVDFTQLGFGQGSNNLIALLWTFEHEVFRTYSYHAQKVISSFVGLAGLFAFYRGLRSCSDRVTPRLLLILGLFPSILFWSSILGKDPINLFGICVFFYGFLSLYARRNPLYLIPIATGLLVVGLIRVWLIPVLLLPIPLMQLSGIRNMSLKLASFGAVFLGAVHSLRYLGTSLAVENADALASKVNLVSRSWNFGGSTTAVPQLDSMGAILKFLPVGMFTALFRPLPGDVMNLFGLFAGAENLFLLYLVYRAARRFRRRGKEGPLILMGIYFVLAWGMLYAFISPQNLGSAVRFKLQVLPVMLTLLLALAYPREPELHAAGSDSERSTRYE